MHKERGRLQRKWSDPGSTRGVEDAATVLLVDAAAFDLRAGYTELAVARIQAALEFNLFRPASITGMVSTPASPALVACESRGTLHCESVLPRDTLTKP